MGGSFLFRKRREELLDKGRGRALSDGKRKEGGVYQSGRTATSQAGAIQPSIQESEKEKSD